MAEPVDPLRPQPQVPPGDPLPRLWRAGPSPEEEAAALAKAERKKSKSKRAGKAAKPDKVVKAKTSKLEETPTLDTYEARRTARIILSVVVFSVISLSGFILYKVVGSGKSDLIEEEVADPRLKPGPASTVASNAPRTDLEQEAKNLFEAARRLARNGKDQDALTSLKKVTTVYPNTAAAREAREALERPARHLPVFLDGPTVVADAAPPTPAPESPQATTVVAVPAAPSPTQGSEEVKLVLPPNPAEPSRTAPDLVHSPKNEETGRPLPAGFHARSGSGLHATGWPLEIVADRDGAPLVFVPGGTFVMGRDDGEPAERPAHQVKLAAYYIDQHEVTVRQFSLYLKETGRTLETVKSPGRSADPPASDDSPMVNVTAREAKAYCEWAGKHLPTEAQWEMAARTIDGRIHPWGPGPTHWEKPRTARQIDPVMSFPSDQSPYGVFDLAGNAWEWTGDIYDSRYFQQFQNSVADNPMGPPHGRSRLITVTVKGGSKEWLCSWRDGVKIEARLPYLGFRGALPTEEPAATAPASKPTTPGGVIPF